MQPAIPGQLILWIGTLLVIVSNDDIQADLAAFHRIYPEGFPRDGHFGFVADAQFHGESQFDLIGNAGRSVDHGHIRAREDDMEVKLIIVTARLVAVDEELTPVTAGGREFCVLHVDTDKKLIVVIGHPKVYFIQVIGGSAADKLGYRLADVPVGFIEVAIHDHVKHFRCGHGITQAHEVIVA